MIEFADNIRDRNRIWQKKKNLAGMFYLGKGYDQMGTDAVNKITNMEWVLQIPWEAGWTIIQIGTDSFLSFPMNILKFCLPKQGPHVHIQSKL